MLVYINLHHIFSFSNENVYLDRIFSPTLPAFTFFITIPISFVCMDGRIRFDSPTTSPESYELIGYADSIWILSKISIEFQNQNHLVGYLRNSIGAPMELFESNH